MNAAGGGPAAPEQQGANHIQTVLTSLLNTSNTPSAAQSFADCYDVASSELGSGFYGKVKLVTERATGKQFAVKIISKENAHPEDILGLQLEADLLCELQHPHIIECYATFDEPDNFYIVTELVEGGELFYRIVAKERYTENDARDLIKLFLEIMVYMHDTAKVVHRDLKPENILLTSKNDDTTIKICDFGLAKRLQDLQQGQEQQCGTPAYCAPEIFRNDPYGCEVDIWSMGVIAFILLSGMPPFYENKNSPTYPNMLKARIRRGQYTFHPQRWDHISPEAKDMVTHMLCVNQKERWTASQLLNHPWILMGEDVLEKKDLSASVASLRKFCAKMQFRKIAHTVIAVRRLSQSHLETIESHVATMSVSIPPLSSAVSEGNERKEGEEDDDDGEEDEEPAPMVGVAVQPSSQRGIEWGCSGSQKMDMGDIEQDQDTTKEFL